MSKSNISKALDAVLSQKNATAPETPDIPNIRIMPRRYQSYMRGEFSAGATPEIPRTVELSDLVLRSEGQNSYVPYPVDGSAERAVAGVTLSFRDYVRDTIMSRIVTASTVSAEAAAKDIKEIHDILLAKDSAAAAAWRAGVAARKAFGALSNYQGISLIEEEALRQTWLDALREEERLTQIALSKEM